MILEMNYLYISTNTTFVNCLEHLILFRAGSRQSTRRIIYQREAVAKPYQVEDCGDGRSGGAALRHLTTTACLTRLRL